MYSIRFYFYRILLRSKHYPLISYKDSKLQRSLPHCLWNAELFNEIHLSAIKRCHQHIICERKDTCENISVTSSNIVKFVLLYWMSGFVFRQMEIVYHTSMQECSYSFSAWNSWRLNLTISATAMNVGDVILQDSEVTLRTHNMVVVSQCYHKNNSCNNLVRQLVACDGVNWSSNRYERRSRDN